MRPIRPIGLILLALGLAAGGFFLFRGQTTTPTPPSSQASSLKLTSPKTTFKASEPVTFVLTFEKKPTSFWPFAKKAFAQEPTIGQWTDGTQTITTEVFYDKEETPTTDIAVEIKPLEEDKFAFSLQRKNLSQLQPGKYQLKVTREVDGQTETINQDFSWGVLAINPNKSIYLPGEIAKIGIGVLNDSGRTICNAAVTLEITDPDGIKTTLSEANKFINKSGYCKETSVTNVPDYLAGYRTGKPGIYKMHLSADNGNGVRSLDDSFEIRESIPFDIERSDFPMRIYPPAEYTGKITIKANQDFKGMVKEEVPEGFKISQISPIGQIRQTNPVQQIGWNVDWKKGQTYTLSYSIKFPPISPEFYLIGPLKLVQSDLSVIFEESRPWQIASDAVTTLFMESGTDATHDGKFYTTFPSNASSDPFLPNTGPRSVKCNSGAGNSACQVRFDNNLADAGRRVTAYFNFTNLPGTGTRIIDFKTTSGGTTFSLNLTNTGQLRLLTLGTNCGNGSTISTGKWYRLSVAYTITSTTDFSIKAFLNGTQDIAATQANCTLNATGSEDLFIGWASQPGANLVMNFDDVYLDNGTTVDDPGNIKVTAKLPSTVNNNEFDFTTGTGAVNERPLSTTNNMNDTTSNTPGALQDYTLQTATQGDMDISDHTLVARTAWVWAARGATGAQTTAASIIDNGTETSITLTSSSAMYSVITDSVTYPSNAAGIGMRAIDGTYDTAFYEGGTLIAYIPTTLSKVKFNGIQMQGIQVK